MLSTNFTVEVKIKGIDSVTVLIIIQDKRNQSTVTIKQNLLEDDDYWNHILNVAD